MPPHPLPKGLGIWAGLGGFGWGLPARFSLEPELSPRDLPIVTLQVQAMDEVISRAFAMHSEQIAAEVQAGVERVVNNFSFEREVARVAEPVLSKLIADAIQNYFWTEGREVLNVAVMSALRELSRK